MHIKVNDIVKVIAGKEIGKTGKVLEINCKKMRARVEKVNPVKKHTKSGRSQKNPYGGIIEMPGTIHISKLLVVCKHCNRGAKTGHRFQADGTKVRFCRKCGEVID